MTNEAPVEVIVNASAGARDKAALVNDLENRLRVYPDWRVSIANSGLELSSIIEAAAAGCSETIVAAGGDGTVNSVARAVIGTKKNLGILPVGTLNHFARDLQIPTDMDAAIQTIVNGNVVSVDVGQVNGLPFINNSSLGLYPSIVSERQKQERLGSSKWAAFFWAMLSVMRRYPFVEVKLDVEGISFDRRTPLVFIGNNRYEMESLNIGARSCLDAGELSLYITSSMSRLGLLRLAFRALFGGLSEEKDFTALCAREIRIDTRRKSVRVALDGEVSFLTSPLHYRVLPKALRVLAPNNVSMT